MSISRMFFWMSASLVALVTISIIFALSAANTVPGTKAGLVTSAIIANQLKPSECAGLNLTNVLFVTPGVPLASTANSNDLIIGTSGNDTITAGKGNDCVIGGDGDDIIQGDQGNDVLLGGPGNDDLTGGAGADVCYGGGGTNTFKQCETTYP